MRPISTACAAALAIAACNSPTDPGVGAPESVAVVSGGGQSQLAGLVLAAPIVVRVVDNNNRPVPDVEIAASTTALGGMIDPTQATTTNEMGEATIRWRLGVAVGAQALRVELPSVAGASAITASATATGADVIEVVGTTNELCAAYRDGRIGCWITVAPESAPSAPVMAPGALRFTGLATGTAGWNGGAPQFLCAAATTGRVWCTDFDFDFDQLSGSFTPWREIAGGYQSLTGLTGAYGSGGVGSQQYCGLDPNGVAWCWGGNSGGKLGDGTTISRDDAQPVTSDARFVSISASVHHVCALEADGTAWCWGENTMGELGRPATPDPHLVPMPVLTSLRFATILATEDGTCGIGHGGGLYCWGNRFQLGRPSPLPPGLDYSDQPLEVPGTGTVAMLANSDNDTFVFGPSGGGVWWGLTHASGFTLTPEPTLSPIPYTELVSKSDGWHICGRAMSGGGVSCLLSRLLGPYAFLGPVFENKFTNAFGIGVPTAP